MLPEKIEEYQQHPVPSGRHANRFFQKREGKTELYYNLYEYDSGYEFEICFESNGYWCRTKWYGMEELDLDELESLGMFIYNGHKDRNGTVSHL